MARIHSVHETRLPEMARAIRLLRLPDGSTLQRMPNRCVTALLLAFLALPGAAFAQRATFERSFDVGAPLVEVETTQGRIEVRRGQPGRVVVTGHVAVRIGWNVPADAATIVAAVAERPPVAREGDAIHLRLPADATQRRAVTISYVVEVPPAARVRAVSESGATRIAGVSGGVEATTQSGALELRDLGGPATVKTGSGAVDVDGVGGALDVTTSSSGITVRGLAGDLRVRTGSGAVEASFSGRGDADVVTGSSSLRRQGIGGALRAESRSGRIIIDGRPDGAWEATAGSGSVEVTMPSAAQFTLDASSGSGSVTLRGGSVDANGVVTKRAVRGIVGGEGEHVRVSSRSGSVRITLSDRSAALSVPVGADRSR